MTTLPAYLASKGVMTFKQYLASKTRGKSDGALKDAMDQLSNWSYLHLSFMEIEPSRLELEVLMHVELTGRNRAQILRRLYSRWHKLERDSHYKELGL